MKKKILSTLLICCMMIGFLPTTALAADGVEDTIYDEYTIVGWENEGPDGAIKSVSIDGTILPQTGGEMKVAPDADLSITIDFNRGYAIGEWLDGVILRWGGIQSGGRNLRNSGSAFYIKAPYKEWLSGVYGEDATDHEIYLIIPTMETELPDEYSVTVQNDGNGTGTASPATAEAGMEVILSTEPSEGYHFKEWQVISPEGLTITDSKFTMPGENVTVKAIFEKDSSGDGQNPKDPSTSQPNPKDPSNPQPAPTDLNTPQSKHDKPGAPQTGDESDFVLWIALLFAGGSITFGTLLIAGKKKRMEA